VAVAPPPLVDAATVKKFKFPLIVALLDTVKLSTDKSPAQAGTTTSKIANGIIVFIAFIVLLVFVVDKILNPNIEIRNKFSASGGSACWRKN